MFATLCQTACCCCKLFGVNTPCSVVNAMLVTDSEPNFRARAAALGMDAATIDALCASGINTISKYAFSSSYVPGAPDEQPFTDATGAALGGPPSLGVMAMLRRLLHESFAQS